MKHCHTPTQLFAEMTPGLISEQLRQLECPTDGNNRTCLLLFGCTAHGRDVKAYVTRASMSSSEHTFAFLTL